ncbi:MAG TPA: DUF533 domain-containing protein, partial [Thermoanaerobaculia bacterium]|nr:DUF533 domain-containing protein [Thermoanaerobaculia bacterium]
AAVPPPAPLAAPSVDETGGDLPVHLAYAAVRTMVAAALADGRLAPEERAAIQARLGDSDLDENQVAQVHQDLVLPPTVEELAALVVGEEDRETLYQLAAVVLQADQRVSDLERVWLGRLGAAFGLAEERCRVLQEEALGPGGGAATG